MNNYISKTNAIIDNLQLPKELEDNKEIIKARFVEEVSYYEKKRDHTKRYYNIFRFVVTIGSIFLPAILSMGQMDPAKLPKNFENISYWTSWTISLMVTGCNGFLQLFSLDKNYFEFAITTEHLKTEGWQYFQLSGKYEEYEDHKEAYKPFCKSIENIKRKQVEKEFPGKADVNKGKQEKKYAFQKELMTNIPQQYQIEREKKTKEMDQKMDKLMDMIGNGKEIVDTVENVRDILTTDINKSLPLEIPKVEVKVKKDKSST